MTALKLRLPLFLALAASAFAQTPATLTFQAAAALTSTTTFAFNGTGTLTGLGNATLSGAGTVDLNLIAGQTATAIPGSFSMIFSDGAVLFGTFDIPAGILIPQSGGATTAPGVIRITGGTGRLEGTRGVFSPLTGSGSATGQTSANITVNGSGTLSIGQYVLPQFVFGGGWYTALYFSNSKTTAENVTVNFISDNGTPLNVPALGGTSTNVNIPAGGTAKIEAPNTGTLVQGYATVTLPQGVTGYGVFRQTVTGVTDQEAVVPLSNAAATSSTLIFDDTGYTTAVALVNSSAVAATVNVTVKSLNGGALGTATVQLPAKSKTAVNLRSLTGLSGIANNSGTATFTVANGNVSVLGLRFFGTALTSIPASDR